VKGSAVVYADGSIGSLSSQGEDVPQTTIARTPCVSGSPVSISQGSGCPGPIVTVLGMICVKANGERLAGVQVQEQLGQCWL
jgi:hypothetical protein